MKIFLLSVLCINLVFSAADWGIITSYAGNEDTARAHVRLSKSAPNFLEKLWHLRRSLDWHILPKASETIATLTGRDQSLITNDASERDGLVKIIPQTKDLWLKQRQIITLYQLCTSVGFERYPIELFKTPYPLPHPFYGLIRFEHPPSTDFILATFGSCLSQRIANALLHILGLPLDESHYNLHVHFCRSDHILDVLFNRKMHLNYNDIEPFIKKCGAELVMPQLPDQTIGQRGLHALRMWSSEIEVKKIGVFEKIDTHKPHLIFLDNFADMKFLNSTHKATGHRLFVRHNWVKNYDHHFVLDKERLPIGESVENFYKIFEHLHTIYPHAHIVFFHFPLNIDPNPRVRERYQAFKEQFHPERYVTVFDMPVTLSDTTDVSVHCTPWYYEKLAHMVWTSMHEKGADH